MSEFSSGKPIHESIGHEQQLEFIAAVEKIVPFMSKSVEFSTPTDEVLDITIREGDDIWVVAKRDEVEILPASVMQPLSLEDLLSSMIVEGGEELTETEEQEDVPLIPVQTSEYTLESVVLSNEGPYPVQGIKRWRILKLNEYSYPSFSVEHVIWKGENIGWEKVQDQDMVKKLKMFVSRELGFDEMDEIVGKRVESIRESEQIMGESSTVFNSARLEEAKVILSGLMRRLSTNT